MLSSPFTQCAETVIAWVVYHVLKHGAWIKRVARLFPVFDHFAQIVIRCFVPERLGDLLSQTKKLEDICETVFSVIKIILIRQFPNAIPSIFADFVHGIDDTLL